MWSFVLLGVQTDTINTLWNQFNWNEADWAGLAKTPIPIGEVRDAHSRELSLVLNGMSTASFQIDLHNPMAYEIESRDSDVLLKAYEGTTLRFVGICTGTEAVGTEEKTSLQANFADAMWRLQHRLCRKSGSTAQPNVSWTATAPGQVITDLLENANRELLDLQPGIADTGVRIGTVDSIDVVTVGVDPPWNNKPLTEAITEMQASKPTGISGAFDFQVKPFEPTSDTLGMKISTLDVRTRVGADRPDVVFEYGGGSRSVSSFGFTRNRQGLLNRALVQGTDPADDTQTVRGYNGTSQQAHGLFEGMVPIDVGDPALRQAWADANVAVRGEAQWKADLTLSSSAPQFGSNPPTDGDYTLGDTARVRITAAGVERLPLSSLRIYGVGIHIDDEGKETMTLQLSPE